MTDDWLENLREANRLFDEHKLDEAEGIVTQVLSRKPDAALAHQLLGMIQVDRFDLPGAMRRLEQALDLRNDLPGAHNSLGHCHVLLGDFDRALDHFSMALCIDPQHTLAHYNRAVVWLKQGHFQEGWVEHEWRFAAGVAKRQNVARPLWDGSPLADRSLLIYTEQGLGDVIQFARFLPILRRQARRLVVACHHPLKPLLQSLNCIDEWFPIDEPHEITFDFYAAMMSLPALLGIEEHNLPQRVPYLFPESHRVEQWARRLPASDALKVGIGWQGNPLFRVDRYRSVPLAAFAPVAALPGVQLISLQKGPGVEQIEPNRTAVPLTVFPEMDMDGVFLDTAAIMQHLDLVITTDTALAHLAGALGRPVWVVLGVSSDWRWQMDRSDSPWYPSMRLFRQRTLGDWSTVLQELAGALAAEQTIRQGTRDS